MVTKSKIIVIATIVALSYAGPVFAQSFDPSIGTGNELPSYYDSGGGLHTGIAPQNTPVFMPLPAVGMLFPDHVRWPR